MRRRRGEPVSAALQDVGLTVVNIVVVVSGSLTETLQAGPLLAALSTATGEPALVACPPAGAEVALGLEGAGEVLAVRGLGGGSAGLGLVRLWSELRRRRLDVAMVCSEVGAVRAAVYVAAVPRRIGCVSGLSDRLLSDRVPCQVGENRGLAWASLIGPLALGTEPAAALFTPGVDATDVAEQLLLSNGVSDGRLLVAIAPGRGFADGAVAEWAAERYAHLANSLASRHGAGIILIGDRGDRQAADAMRLDMAADTIDLCGELNLATTAAVIARCDLFIAGDTPLLHLAAAVGTPSVGLFGPTKGRLRAPAGAQHRVVQAIRAADSPITLDPIRVEDVLASIESSL